MNPIDLLEDGVRSESIAIFPQHQPAGRELGRARYLGFGALVGLIIGALGFAVVASTVDVVQAALSSQTSAAVAEPLVEYPARELPREWKGAREPVAYQHMYRQQGSPRLDWIRNGGAR